MKKIYYLILHYYLSKNRITLRDIGRISRYGKKIGFFVISLFLITGCATSWPNFDYYNPEWGKCATAMYVHQDTGKCCHFGDDYYPIVCDEYMPMHSMDKALYIDGMMIGCKIYPHAMLQNGWKERLCGDREHAEIPYGRYTFHIDDGMGVWILYGEGNSSQMLITGNSLSNNFVDRIKNEKH